MALIEHVLRAITQMIKWGGGLGNLGISLSTHPVVHSRVPNRMPSSVLGTGDADQHLL